MPRYLSLFIPARPNAGPPSPEHMAQMGKLVEEQTKAGKLIMTGGLKRRDGDGFIVKSEGGHVSVDTKPQAEWMLAGGWAILQAADRAAVIDDVKKFLSVVGDGRCEVIELFEPSA
jgi:hypothetical protein